MNPLAVVVAVAALGGLFFACWYLLKFDGLAVENERLRGNEWRADLARNTNSGFYSYEAEDGSLSWRRVAPD